MDIARFLLERYDTEKYPPLPVRLPSNGLVYSERSYVAETGHVLVRKITGRDELWASDGFLVDDKDKLKDIVGTLIIDPPCEPAKMLAADFDAIILALRVDAYGQDLGELSETTCEECGELLQVFDKPYHGVIQKTEIEYLSSLKFFPHKKNENAFQYAIKNLTISYGLRQVADEADDKTYTNQIIDTVMSINGVEDKQKIRKTFSTMPISISRKFFAFVEKNSPYVRVILAPLRCLKCEHETVISSRIGHGLLAINKSYIKQSIFDEAYLLHRRLRLPWDNILEMPVGIRKEFVRRDLDALKKENSPGKEGDAEPMPLDAQSRHKNQPEQAP